MVRYSREIVQLQVSEECRRDLCRNRQVLPGRQTSRSNAMEASPGPILPLPRPPLSPMVTLPSPVHHPQLTTTHHLLHHQPAAPEARFLPAPVSPPARYTRLPAGAQTARWGGSLLPGSTLLAGRPATNTRLPLVQGINQRESPHTSAPQADMHI